MIWVWWHSPDGNWGGCQCPYVRAWQIDPEGETPKSCTCVDEKFRPLPGRWREFREVSPLPKEEGFECL